MATADTLPVLGYARSRMFERYFSIEINETPTDDGTVEPNTARIISSHAYLGAKSSPRNSLRVQFSVTKNIMQEELNAAEVIIYNLSVEHRALLQKRFSPLRIDAGYKDNHGNIYNGQVTVANHLKTGPDWQTKFSTLDGMQIVTTRRINETLAPGATVRQAFDRLVESMTAGKGNYIQELTKGLPAGVPAAFTRGFAMVGRPWDIISKLAKSIGYDISIQDNAIQLLGPDGSIGGIANAVLLDAQHGLIGNAEEGEDTMRQPAVVCRSLMNAAFKPGALVLLTSRNIDTSLFRVYSAKHHGDTHGNDWYTDLVLSRVPESSFLDLSNASADAAIA